VFPNLIANQIASVQPMTAPVGAVFNYDYKYEGRKGAKVPQGGIADNPWNMGYDGAVAAGDAMIKNFAGNYSSEYVDYDVLCTDTGSGTTTLTQSGTNCRVPGWKPIRTPGTSGQRTFFVKLYYRHTADTGYEDKIATLDPTGLTSNLVDQYGHTVGTFVTTTGAWTLTPVAQAGGALAFTNNTVIYAKYFVNFELVGSTAGAAIGGVSLDIAMSTVTAETRALKATWSAEAMDDLRSLHGIDAEAELVAGISNEIALEIDRQIIGEMMASAVHASTYTYSSTCPGEIESIRELLTHIDAVSAQIHTSTLRAPGNFLVMSPRVAALLSQLTSHADFSSGASQVTPPTYGPLTSDFGIQMIGTLMRKYTVYQDPFMTTNQVLVGLRGSSFLDAGFAFAPYVPLQVTPTWQDPETFRFKKGMRSRYATKMLRPEYYGIVTVAGLPTVTSTY
jgi:hypothetical protein